MQYVKSGFLQRIFVITKHIMMKKHVQRRQLRMEGRIKVGYKKPVMVLATDQREIN